MAAPCAASDFRRNRLRAAAVRPAGLGRQPAAITQRLDCICCLGLGVPYLLQQVADQHPAQVLVLDDQDLHGSIP